MFCIKCGMPATVGSFCDEHFLEKEELFEIANIRIDVCDRCGAYFDRGWKETKNIADAVSGVIKNGIATKNKIKKISIGLKKFGNKYKATIAAIGFIPPCKAAKAEEKNILITLNKKKCDDCVKMLGKYYEALIQVRGENKNEILKKIREMTDKKMLSDFKELSNGYDLYFIRKADAGRIAGSLKRRYDIKRSFKFAAEKKGKKLYRNYFAVR